MYDKEKICTRKITGRYLEFITEQGGFKESRKRIMEREIEELKAGKPIPETEAHVGVVKEYGMSDYILEKQSGCIEPLKEYFPKEWSRIVALAYCRLRFQSPMQRVLGGYRKIN